MLEKYSTRNAFGKLGLSTIQRTLAEPIFLSMYRLISFKTVCHSHIQTEKYDADH